MTYVSLDMCCRCHTQTLDLYTDQVGHAYCVACRDADGGRHFHQYDRHHLAS